ncbi:MAG: bifunctional riboflavin kinase/FAD synthetase [Aeromonadales bacterium]|nr:bifunctional riboflavin kinase/FAD synthetase [Aeromonadales bacterium]
MRLIRSLKDYERPDCGIALAIGNFDGFHLGHRRVVSEMMERARSRGLKSAVMLFEPHPREFFQGENAPARLSTLRDKLFEISSLCPDYVFCMRFNRAFALMESSDFVKDLLHEKLGVRCVVVGSLFAFGRGARCGIDDLRRLGAPLGIEADAIEGVTLDGERISSTMVRALLKAGDFRRAEQALGHPFSMGGRVAHGRELGRHLGFPTANIALKRLVAPLDGVYAVRVAAEGGAWDGMCNVGTRPSIEEEGKQSLIEANLFGFDGDLYGKRARVYFFEKIRDEQKFPDLNSLRGRLMQDKEACMMALSARRQVIASKV